LVDKAFSCYNVSPCSFNDISQMIKILDESDISVQKMDFIINIASKMIQDIHEKWFYPNQCEVGNCVCGTSPYSCTQCGILICSEKCQKIHSLKVCGGRI